MENRFPGEPRSGGVAIPEPIRSDGSGATDPGPRDIMRDLENPDMLVPPVTDQGLIPNLKFSFSDTHMQLDQGGWSREITIRELPVATTLAGVNMRLTPGGVRELHWHQQAEWSFMIDGRARITAVDQDGRNFIADVGVGDLWYFPPGIPHSIQGLEEGCEFLLVFDDGHFSDMNTLSISDWFAHTPKEVLAANFGVPRKAFDHIPKEQVYIYQGRVPGPLESQKITSPYGEVPLSFTHRMLAQKPLKTPGGSVRIADSSNFPISKTVAAALVEIKPGGMRELHWHPNNDEWQYYLSGQGRMTVLPDTERRARLRPGGGCGLCTVCLRALHPKYGRQKHLVFGNLQKRPVCGHLLKSVDGFNAQRAGPEQPACRSFADGRAAEGKVAGGEILAVPLVFQYFFHISHLDHQLQDVLRIFVPFGDAGEKDADDFDRCMIGVVRPFPLLRRHFGKH